MDTVNLLSREIAPKNSIVRASRVLKVVSLGGLVVFIGVTLVIIAIFVANRVELSRIRSNQAVLRQSIQNMQATEQQYVLVKDRASKGVQAVNNNSAEDDMDYYRSFFDLVDEDVSIIQTSVKSSAIEMQINSTNINAITKVLDLLKNNENYGNVIVNSFAYRGGIGYSLEVEIQE